MKRRNFLHHTGMASAGVMASSLFAGGSPIPADANKVSSSVSAIKKGAFSAKSGLGGVAIGNGFQPHTDLKALQTMESAWNTGVRHFDTSPWYGLGISERRMGLYLKDKNRADFILSSKIGRILHPEDNFQLENGLWKGKLNFRYVYDYSAAGARKSVEDSLQRLGVASLDIVYIHDLSPDNDDFKGDWEKHFQEAAKGAMPELTKMREEGLIKGWGLGVNTIEPILKTFEVADPDVFLSACQYSLMLYEDALNKVFPIAAEKDVKIVVGAPLSAGYLAGKDRYLYGGNVPAGMAERRAALMRVASAHQVDLRTAALQFSAAPEVVSAVIPGASTAAQASANAASFAAEIPIAFWDELKQEGLLAEHTPIPTTNKIIT
ncbi:aldo/keto reductase [Sphingobacterium sp. lm-10]|uniref:aldo/keto reductase n=1 Tax=Sphingobacterium sp. lm-10 TaxID=2944904 RepID=UPI002020E715|nr:aldo/keto reductase [Sphingobacterium sp. lm-10]MCL7989240.1 aldo/keto reductase [Sphingobacterium sp. lm-10]